MSLAWTQAVWQRSASRMGARLVLLAIAEHARDETGIAWPSTATLASMTGMDRRNVRRCLNTLIELGELQADDRIGGNQSTRYRILLGQTPDKLSSPKEEGPRTNCPPTPDKNDPPPRTNCPPNHNKTLRKPNKAILPELPQELDTPQSRSAWLEFLAHRRELKKPVTPTGAIRIFQDFSAGGSEAFAAALQNSVRNGWQGIFKPNERTHHASQRTHNAGTANDKPAPQGINDLF